MSTRKRKIKASQILQHESDLLEKVYINDEKGYGVRTKKFIPKHTICVEYKGTFGLKRDNIETVDNGWTFSLRKESIKHCDPIMNNPDLMLNKIKQN
jgi:hypothetical protein